MRKIFLTCMTVMLMAIILTIFAGGTGSIYKNGVYTGTAQGYNGPIEVSLSIKNGRIREIKVLKQNETISDPRSVCEQLSGKVIVAQSVDKIDAVSGATITSKAFLTAVRNALDKAEGKVVSAENEYIGKPSKKDTTKENKPMPDIQKTTTGDSHKKVSLGTKHVTPVPVWVVGTYDSNGKPNVMTAAWAGICSSNPPSVYVALRKATYTHGNISLKKAFTVNLPSSSQIKETDYFGMVSGKDTDKFKASSMTPVKAEFVDAPYVKEFPLILECQLIKTVENGSHTIFIGEIKDVKADEAILGNNSSLNLSLLSPVFYSPSDRNYYNAVTSPSGKGFSEGEIFKKQQDNSKEKNQ